MEVRIEKGQILHRLYCLDEGKYTIVFSETAVTGYSSLQYQITILLLCTEKQHYQAKKTKQAGIFTQNSSIILKM